MEKYITVKGYSMYEVSDLGNVRNIKSKRILIPFINKAGYISINLKNDVTKGYDCLYLHRVVAENHIPNPQNKPQVNHINGDKTKNTTTNLEWCTQLENIRHSWATGLCKTKNVNYINNDDLIGQVITSNSCGDYKVIKYSHYDKAHYFLVEFLNTGNQKYAPKCQIQEGSVGDYIYITNGIVNNPKMKELISKHKYSDNYILKVLYSKGKFDCDGLTITKAINHKEGV